MGRIGLNELDEKYEVLKLVDTGGTSQVFLVSDRRINSQWAIKKVRKKARAIETTMTEVNMLKRLSHPSLPRILDIHEDDEHLYTVMDYVPGENLRTILRADGAQDQDSVVRWGIELCDVLTYLHKKGIIYRDMKPSNIILTPEGTIKLIDLGIAREYKPQATEDTTSLGTEGYAAPEQYEGQGQSDVRTDIFGIGVTLFQLLTDINPATYRENTFSIRLANPALSSGLDRIILKCTNRSKDKRYQTTEELKEALSNYRLYDTENIKKEGRRKGLALSFLISAGVCFVLSGLFFFLGYRQSEDNYESLLAETQNQKKIEEAIELKPSRTDGYIALLNSYGESFSQEELSDFSHVYAMHQSEIKDKDEIAMTVGERILSSYEEESLRSKLLMAEPYFNLVSEEYEKYPAASAYTEMSGFYKTYILQGEGTLVKEAGKKEYESLLKRMTDVINLISGYDGTEQKNLLLTSSELCLGLIGEEYSSMRAQGIEKSKVEDVVRLISGKVNEVDPKIEVLKTKKDRVLILIGNVTSLLGEQEKLEA